MTMLRPLVLSVMLQLSFQIGFAQFDYFANDPIWQYGAYNNPGGVPHCFTSEVYIETVGEDTIINGTFYKKYYQRGIIETYWMWEPPIVNCGVGIVSYTDGLIGYIRQDETRIYLWYDWEVEERLAIEFDLQVGDTLPPCTYTGWDDDVAVIERDTIELAGIQRIRLKVSFPDGSEDYLIEGIGSTTEGLRWFGIGLGFDSGLSCFGHGNESYYPVVGGNCDIGLSIHEPEQRISIVAFPNPSSGSVTLILPAKEVDEVLLQSMTGQIVVRLPVKNDRSIDIDLHDIVAGIYMVQARSIGGVVASGKIILQ